jgi:hypothetical protein
LAYPEDPLLQFKSPVKGETANSGPRDVFDTEPTPPPEPVIAVARPEKPHEPPATFRTAERPATPTSANTTSRGETLVTESNDPHRVVPAASTTMPIKRLVPETYGRAPDYSWLQGTLERHHKGHWELRYCDLSVADKWGGKVMLVNDPRLATYQDGAVVLVEGEMKTVDVGKDATHRYPTFAIRQVWLAK